MIVQTGRKDSSLVVAGVREPSYGDQHKSGKMVQVPTRMELSVVYNAVKRSVNIAHKQLPIS